MELEKPLLRIPFYLSVPAMPIAEMPEDVVAVQVDAASAERDEIPRVQLQIGEDVDR